MMERERRSGGVHTSVLSESQRSDEWLSIALSPKMGKQADIPRRTSFLDSPKLAGSFSKNKGIAIGANRGVADMAFRRACCKSRGVML
jgi:hypothetical protein